MSVGKICIRTVYTATREESVLEAARRMQRHDVGTLVVVESGARPVGILTDRDILVSCVACGRDPAATSIGTVMTKPIEEVEDSEAIESALARMRAKRLRRLAVVDRARSLVGILSVDDVLQLLAEEFESIGKIFSRPSSLSMER